MRAASQWIERVIATPLKEAVRSDRRIVETRDLNEDVLVEFDEHGCVVSLTIEHEKQQTDVTEFTYQLASG
jgi:uncharacterized protein YuzE